MIQFSSGFLKVHWNLFFRCEYKMNKAKALRYLRQALQNPKADFRQDQWECIQAVLQKNKVLVVQRTGWGKSMVYFLATRLLRDQGSGPTLLVSPLISLMRNQLEAAKRIGLNARTINSSNDMEHEEIFSELKDNKIDLLLISPERLANDKFKQNVLRQISGNIGLFVIDEAHCISDWGHDFRQDYQRIVRIIKFFPPRTPILATTATANNRVVADIQSQLGSDLHILRGSLVRDSLILQNIDLKLPGARLAWLAWIIPKLPGSGIVYTLTVRDAIVVSRWLRLNNINAKPYYADIEKKDLPLSRTTLEDDLLQNRLKVLVATVALGMGFDKPDLNFVIHYQRPASVVHYYQQAGRAGRSINKAYAILLNSNDADSIADYFRKSAFPDEKLLNAILDELNNADYGLSVAQMQQLLNCSKTQIDKALKFLTFADKSPIIKNKSRWFLTAAATTYEIDHEMIDRLNHLRVVEQKQMQEYINYDGCLMSYLQKALDDPHPMNCGHCQYCSPNLRLPDKPPVELINQANFFLRHNYQEVEPRKRWPASNMFEEYDFAHSQIPEDLLAEKGRALCLWRDDGWGNQVYEGKYKQGHFSDELVQACVELFNDWNPNPSPRWVCCIPSTRHPTLVPDFAKRLAQALQLPFEPCISNQREHPQQKLMNNSFKQAKNLDGVFSVKNHGYLNQPCLLVDDMVDSRWTFTIAAALLRSKGCPAVYPLALAMNALGK